MGKRFLCLILAILIAFSAVGCSKEDLGNARLFDAGQTSDADTFEDLTDDWFCRQMEADPMSCHFTLENPDAYHITFSDRSAHCPWNNISRNWRRSKICLTV